MSRLDSAIRRLDAQRACLDWAAEAIAGRPGCVFELGLGNGRSYDHLRTLLADREIHVFDRVLGCHPDCRPPPELFHLGEIRESLGMMPDKVGRTVILAHMDLGAGSIGDTSKNLAGVADALTLLLAPGALVLSDQPLECRAFTALPMPPGVPDGRYQIYQTAP